MYAWQAIIFEMEPWKKPTRRLKRLMQIVLSQLKTWTFYVVSLISFLIWYLKSSLLYYNLMALVQKYSRQASFLASRMIGHASLQCFKSTSRYYLIVIGSSNILLTFLLDPCYLFDKFDVALSWCWLLLWQYELHGFLHLHKEIYEMQTVTNR